jgi:hypothetical protein
MPNDLQSLGSFDPEVLAVLHRAFDDVWLQLEGRTALAIRDATRDAIATALIQAAIGGERDPEKLWCHAMNRARALSTLQWMSEQSPLTPTAEPTREIENTRQSARR